MKLGKHSKGSSDAGSVHTYGTMEVGNDHGERDSEDETPVEWKGTSHTTIRLTISLTMASIIMYPGGWGAILEFILLAYLLAILPNWTPPTTLAPLTISLFTTTHIWYSNHLPVPYYIPQVLVAVSSASAYASIGKRGTIWTSCRSVLTLMTMVLPAMYAVTRPSVVSTVFLLPALLNGVFSAALPVMAVAAGCIEAASEVYFFDTTPPTYISLLLGPSWGYIGGVAGGIHVVCCGMMAASFASTPGASMSDLVIDIDKSYLMYSTVMCITEYALVEAGIGSGVMIGAVFVALGSYMGRTQSFAVLGLILVEALELALWYCGVINNLPLENGTEELYESLKGVWLFGIYTLTILLDHAFLSSTDRDGLMSPSTWGDPYNPQTAWEKIRRFHDDLYDHVPNGAAKMTSLLIFISESLSVPDVPHAVLLVTAIWCFASPRPTVGQWRVLVGVSEICAVFFYLTGWVFPLTTFSPTFIKPYTSPWGLVRVILGVSLAVRHSVTISPSRTAYVKKGFNVGAPEHLATTLSLLSITATVTTTFNAVLLPISVAVLTVGGYHMGSRYYFILAVAATSTVSAVFYTSQFSDTTRSTITTYTGPLQNPSIWYTTTLLHLYTVTRYWCKPPNASKWVHIVMSLIVSPLVMLAASTYHGAANITGAVYLLTLLSTAFTRLQVVLSYVTGGGEVEGGLYHVKAMVAASGFFVAHVLFAPSWCYEAMISPIGEVVKLWGVGFPMRPPPRGDLYIHLAVLGSAMLENWAVLKTQRPFSPNALCPGLLCSWLYEIVLAVLAVSTTFEQQPFLSTISMGLLILSCSKGKRAFITQPQYATTLYFTYLCIGCVTYVAMSPDVGYVALHCGVTLVVAGFRAGISFEGAESECCEVYTEGYTQHLVENQSEIDEARTKNSSVELRSILAVESPTMTGTVKEMASYAPHILLIFVFIDGAVQERGVEGSFIPLSYTEVARVLFAVTQIPSLNETVWVGNHVWRLSYVFYTGLACWWLVDAMGGVPSSLSENGGTIGIGLVITSLLWRWGRVMDSRKWGEVLLHIHSKGTRGGVERERILHERKTGIETAQREATRQRRLRKKTLAALDFQKENFSRAWQQLLKDSPLPKKQSVSPAFLPNATPDTAPNRTPRPITPLAEICSKILSFSYKPTQPSTLMESIYLKGAFHTVATSLQDAALSLCAEGIYLGTAFHFISNPCVSTLLPLASVLLYAMCSALQPMSGYWKGMVVYYQAVIGVKAVMLCFFMKKGSIVNSNSVLMLLFGWRTSLQADGQLALLQFISWESVLLVVLLVHRHALANYWGLWGGVGDRLIPRTKQLNEWENLPEEASVWGGWRCLKTSSYLADGGQEEVVIGGAAVQMSIQGLTVELPPSLGRKLRRILRNLVNATMKFGIDLYAPAFVIDLVAWVVLLAGYSALMGSNESIADSIKNNLLPGALVLALFILFLVMVVDRVVYTLRSLYAKTFLHVFLTFTYLGAYQWWCYYHIEKLGPASSQAASVRPTTILQLFCGLKVAYLAFSALQVRNGFPEQTRHFFTGKYSSTWYGVYAVYRAVPFLFEFKSVLDWTFTRTSLKMPYWLRLEDITHEVHCALCDQKDTERLSEIRDSSDPAYPWYLKCRSGTAILSALSVILFFPLLWYSSIGPALAEDFITGARIEVGVFGEGVGYGVMYQEAFMINEDELGKLQREGLALSLPTAWTKAIESTRPDLEGFGLSYDGTKTVQMIPFMQASGTAWGVSPETRRQLTAAVLMKNTSLSFSIKTSIKRPFAPLRSQWMSSQQHYTLNETDLTGLGQVLTGKSAWFMVANMFTPVLFNKVESLGYFTGESNKIPCNVSLDEATWGVRCGTLFQYGNPPSVINRTEVGVGGFPFSPEEASCITASIYEQTSACRKLGYTDPTQPTSHPHHTSGPYYLAISDLIAAGSMSVIIPSLGVVALYTTFVLAVGRVLRASLTGDAVKVHLTDMDSPQYLNTLIDHVHLARVEGDLELEFGLYKSLIYLLKSPEALQHWIETLKSSKKSVTRSALLTPPVLGVSK